MSCLYCLFFKCLSCHTKWGEERRRPQKLLNCSSLYEYKKKNYWGESRCIAKLGFFYEPEENSGFQPNVFQLRVLQKLRLYTFFNSSVLIYKNSACVLMKMERNSSMGIHLLSCSVLNFIVFFSDVFSVFCMDDSSMDLISNHTFYLHSAKLKCFVVENSLPLILCNRITCVYFLKDSHVHTK